MSTAVTGYGTPPTAMWLRSLKTGDTVVVCYDSYDYNRAIYKTTVRVTQTGRIHLVRFPPDRTNWARGHTDIPGAGPRFICPPSSIREKP